MNDEPRCHRCGEPMPSDATICRHCGWDLRTAVARPPRPSLLAVLRSGAWRVLVYGAILALPFLGFLRLRSVGPGPDLETTLRWLAAGDGGRSQELVTLHRAHEIASAAARFAVRELEAPSFDDGWADRLAPYATLRVRGWIPLLFWGATTDMAPASVRTFYEVRDRDGWGRPYRVSARPLPRGPAAASDPEVLADLEAGLWSSFFRMETPTFDEDTEWIRLELVSPGADGSLETADDLTVVSYFPVSFTLRLTRRQGDLQRRLEIAFTQGRHHFRLEGNRWDLVDARLLAEFRLESLL